MTPRLPPLVILALLAMAATASAGQAATDTVRIYRCVDSQGRIALQDSPCRNGREQVLERIRPKDPAPVRSAASPAAQPATPEVLTRVVEVSAPPPLYRCITDSGQQYTSEDGQGNPRWVPGGVPVWVTAPGLHHSGLPSRQPPRRPWPPAHGAVLVASPGYWVRDTCQRMGRQQACRHLADERWQLISRYNSALQSERAVLQSDQQRVEERMGEQRCAR